MQSRNVRVRESQKEYIDQSAYSLSKLVRNAIEEARAGDREFRTGNTRRSHDDDYIRTSVLIDEHHEFWLQDEGVNFSQFVDDVIQDRIDLERQLNDLDE